jgi:hypothetical protein
LRLNFGRGGQAGRADLRIIQDSNERPHTGGAAGLGKKQIDKKPIGGKQKGRRDAGLLPSENSGQGSDQYFMMIGPPHL